VRYSLLSNHVATHKHTSLMLSMEVCCRSQGQAHAATAGSLHVLFLLLVLSLRMAWQHKGAAGTCALHELFP
jgi:hypothetical protein